MEMKNNIYEKPSEKSIKVIDELSNLRKSLLRTDDFFLESYRRVSNDFFISHAGEKESVKNIENIEIITDDLSKITLRKYTPVTQENIIVLYAHGGGWIQGNLETHDYTCRKISNAFSAEVVSVDYRLAPEHRFPTPLNDFFCAYRWCVEKNPHKKIIISGDSSGGNLCAALCVKLVEEKYKQTPHAQMLIYPVLSSNVDTHSFRIYENLEVSMVDYIYQYVGKQYNDPSVISNPYIYPLVYENVSVFPKTILIPAECDVLLDSQLELEKKLKKAKIPAIVIRTHGTINGFMMYGKEFDDEVDYVLKEAKFFIQQNLG